MRDGRLNRCKACVKTRVKNYAKANPEKVRRLGREKRRRPKYRRMDKQWHRDHPEARKKHKQKWLEENPEKRKAENAVSNALRDGKLKRPRLCEGCGRRRKLQAHHPDYSKPLEVQWLCYKCHGETRVKPECHAKTKAA
jgi:hypothetical protein